MSCGLPGSRADGRTACRARGRRDRGLVPRSGFPMLYACCFVLGSPSLPSVPIASFSRMQMYVWHCRFLTAAPARRSVSRSGQALHCRRDGRVLAHTGLRWCLPGATATLITEGPVQSQRGVGRSLRPPRAGNCSYRRLLPRPCGGREAARGTGACACIGPLRPLRPVGAAYALIASVLVSLAGLQLVLFH